MTNNEITTKSIIARQARLSAEGWIAAAAEGQRMSTDGPHLGDSDYAALAEALGVAVEALYANHMDDAIRPFEAHVRELFEAHNARLEG